MEPYQSAYRALYSTETALLKVKTDIISALDCQEVACLILLDLSAVFDTIDHSTLLQGLQQQFAVSSTSLEWFCSYLTNRTQSVVIGDPLSDGCKSVPIPLRSGILQGSFLGPILFMLYTVLLGDICRSNGIEFHLYADDTQVYMTFKPSVPIAKEECIAMIEKSIGKIDIWMSQNLLKLNRDKTEFIMFGIRQQLTKVSDIHLQKDLDKVVPMEHVRNLGYIMDRSSFSSAGPMAWNSLPPDVKTCHSIETFKSSLITPLQCLI